MSISRWDTTVDLLAVIRVFATVGSSVVFEYASLVAYGRSLLKLELMFRLRNRKRYAEF